MLRVSIMLAACAALWLPQTIVAASIAVDVGHYLAKPGVISARGVTEFEYNRQLALEIAEALRRAGHKTLLFEAGVIVNRDEELRMRDPAVRQRIAGAISAAASDRLGQPPSRDNK